MNCGVDESLTSHSAPTTLCAPARKNAHDNPTSPSPEYARFPAPSHAEIVTNCAVNGCFTISRAYNLYASPSLLRITADSSGRVTLAVPCVTKCKYANRSGLLSR